MDEFIKKLKSLREKIREESPLQPFLPSESTPPEETEPEPIPGMEVTHFGPESSVDKKSNPPQADASPTTLPVSDMPEPGQTDSGILEPGGQTSEEPEGGSPLDNLGDREIDLSALGGFGSLPSESNLGKAPSELTQSELDSEKEEKRDHEQRIRALLEKGLYDQAIEEIQKFQKEKR